MRITNIIFTVLLSFMLIAQGCTDEEILPTGGSRLVGNVLSIPISVPGEAQTQTTPDNTPTRLAAVKSEKNISFKWEEGDQLQLYIVYGDKSERQVVSLKDISEDGKVARIEVVLPEGDYTEFDLHGIYGGIITEWDNAKATLNFSPAAGSLEEIQNSILLRFSTREISKSNPNPTVALEHIGSLFNIQVTNKGTTGWDNLQEMALVAETPIGAYNNSGTGQYDLITGEFSGIGTGNNKLTFSFNSPVTIPAGETVDFWGYFIPVAGEVWPAMKLQVLDTNDNVVGITTTAKPARQRPTPAGKAFYIDTHRDDHSLNFNEYRMDVLRGTRGTGGYLPRFSETGRANLDRLLEQLLELNVNTYCWWVYQYEENWDDLQLFLPIAEQHGINIWVLLLSPAQIPPVSDNIMAPYWGNYETWVREIARLSVKHPNLVAWAMDDFYGTSTLKVFTPEFMSKLRNLAHSINPNLAFVPTIYYGRSTVPGFAEEYREFFDAILLPYKADSSGEHNFNDTHLFESEANDLRERFRSNLPIILDLYSHEHPRVGNPTPEYVREMLKLGDIHADGTLIYKHPDKYHTAFREKYHVVMRHFTGGEFIYPTSSYELSYDGTRLLSWSGSEGLVDMTLDPVLDKVQHIDNRAFDKQHQLVYITLGNNVQTIGTNPFYFVRGLYEIGVGKENQWFKSINRALYSKDGKILYAYPYGKTNVETVIDDLPEGLEVIESTAARNMTTLVSVRFPNSLREIKSLAFANSANIKKVEFGENIQKMTSAFMTCLAITEIVIKAKTPPEIDANTFGHPTDAMQSFNFYENCTLYVPKGATNAYENAPHWSMFRNIVELE